MSTKVALPRAESTVIEPCPVGLEPTVVMPRASVQFLGREGRAWVDPDLRLRGGERLHFKSQLGQGVSGRVLMWVGDEDELATARPLVFRPGSDATDVANAKVTRPGQLWIWVSRSDAPVALDLDVYVLV